MIWNKIKIVRENGEEADAQAPVIVSASRSTDIPAFYSDCFFHRLKIGYSAWKNPFNGVQNYVSYKNTRFVIFWSKNPQPLIPYLDELKNRGIQCYIQYTLNDYIIEEYEHSIPPLDKRIDTFKRLVDKLGKGRVIWRFDPLILNDKISIDNLLHKAENIGKQLQGYTEKMVFSYADIATYKKVKSNLEKNHINYREWDELQMEQFAAQLQTINKKWNYQLATCGEKIDIEKYGIQHNRCIDDDLMIRFAYTDKVLMDFLGVEIKQKESDLFNPFILPLNGVDIDGTHYAIKKKNNKDKGQRLFCGCVVSKDVGEYNTCPHLCEYCYANSSKELAVANYKMHKNNEFGETITGK